MIYPDERSYLIAQIKDIAAFIEVLKSLGYGCGHRTIKAGLKDLEQFQERLNHLP